jgi:hypothetical protein
MGFRKLQAEGVSLLPLIPLSHGKSAIVDESDFYILSQNRWKFNNRGYAVRLKREDGKCKTISMHRVILNALPGQIVDHINGDPLDNRKSNLRIVNNSQNSWNLRTPSSSSTGYKGVTSEKKTGKYVAHITFKNKTIKLGTFESKHDAARMYNFWANDLFGEFARLNVINETEANA